MIILLKPPKQTKIARNWLILDSNLVLNDARFWHFLIQGQRHLLVAWTGVAV